MDVIVEEISNANEEGGEEVGAWKVLKLDDDAIIYLIYVIYDFERRSVTL